jgi:hypothetical protein
MRGTFVGVVDLGSDKLEISRELLLVPELILAIHIRDYSQSRHYS